MFLHKYKVDEGTVYLLNSKRNPGDLNLNLPSKGIPTIKRETIKNLLINIDEKFREDPLPEEEPQQPEEKTEEKAEERKASIASVLRNFASALKEE